MGWLEPQLVPCRAVGVYRLVLCSGGRGRAAELVVENSNPASARDLEFRLVSARGDCPLVRLVRFFVHIFLMSLDT